MTPDQLGMVVLGCIMALVVVVGLFSVLPKPPWLDRLWLWAIGAAFVFWVPIWVVLKIQEHGWKAVATFAVGTFLAGFVRGWPAVDSSRS